MRQAKWGNMVVLSDTQPITSHLMRRMGYDIHDASYVAQIKRTHWAAGGSVAAHTEQLVERVAEVHGVPAVSVRDTLRAVVSTTRRITLYHADINAAKLIVAAQADVELRRHVLATLQIYANLDNEFTRGFFDSNAGQLLADEFGFAEHDGAWFETSGLQTCEACDEYIFPNEETHRVFRDGELDEFYRAHARCCEDSYIQYCEIAREWFDTNYVTFVTLDDTGEDVCYDYCFDRDLIYEDEDDFGDTVYRRERPSGEGNLADYHHAPRPWLQGARIPNGYIGVELELGFKRGAHDRAKFLEAFVNRNGRAKDGPFLFEHDGSLSEVPGGMEIVSDPLALHAGYQAKDAPWRQLLANLYKAGAEGWKHRRYAGIHVNLCVCDESDASIFKYAAFISNAAAMSKFIAGRKTIYGTDDGYPKVPPHMLRDSDPRKQMDSQFARGKYAAVNRRNRDCLETRIFGSNIRYEGFMACVEYCVAVMEFVRPLHILDVSSSTISGEFRNWLGSKTQRFPNLTSRLGIVAHALGSAVPSTSRVAPVLLAA